MFPANSVRALGGGLCDGVEGALPWRLIGLPKMRRLLLLALLGLAACTQAQASRVDERTFRIEGPGVPGGADEPNRRAATRVCPKGYRVIDQETHRNGPNPYVTEPGVYTNWTIRCL